MVHSQPRGDRVCWARGERGITGATAMPCPAQTPALGVAVPFRGMCGRVVAWWCRTNLQARGGRRAAGGRTCVPPHPCAFHPQWVSDILTRNVSQHLSHSEPPGRGGRRGEEGGEGRALLEQGGGGSPTPLSERTQCPPNRKKCLEMTHPVHGNVMLSTRIRVPSPNQHTTDTSKRDTAHYQPLQTVDCIACATCGRQRTSWSRAAISRKTGTKSHSVAIGALKNS